MSGVKNNVGRGINMALVNGKWHLSGQIVLIFKLFLKFKVKCYGMVKGKHQGEKEVLILFILR